MKRTLILLFVFSVLLISCKKEQEEYNGIITGYDLRDCPCCGGTFIKISGTTYRFFNLPAKTDVKLDTNTIFPIYVIVSCHKSTEPCSYGNDLLIIDQIRKN